MLETPFKVIPPLPVMNLSKGELILINTSIPYLVLTKGGNTIFLLMVTNLWYVTAWELKDENPQFLFKDYVPTSRSVQQIEWAITFFSKNEDLIESSTSIENEGFPLDYSFLIEEKNLQEVWPQLKEDLHTTPSITLAVLSMALYQVVSTKSKI